MSSSNRLRLSRRAACLAVLAVAGCGFTPVYAPGGAGGKLRGTIAYEAPATDEGFRLRGRFEDRLGRADAPDYVLSTALAITETPLAISSNQDINRYNLVGEATWALRSRNDDAVLFQGTVDTFTSYSALGTTVATLEAERDARERLAIALADLIVTQLMIRAAELP